MTTPCKCSCAAYPHRPGSVKGCEHNARMHDEFFARVLKRMDEDQARVLRTTIDEINRAELAR